MHYLNSLLRDSMPDQQRVAVDSSPTMHAIHDMINSTAASESSEIKLPEQFYNRRVRDIVDMIAFEEEYSAFQESQEMRRVGIGALLGDVVEKLVIDVEQRLPRTDTEVIPGPSPKLFLAGSHDSTLAAIMASLGAVDEKTRRKWPPYGSVVSIELFSDPNGNHDIEAINNTVSTLSSISRTATHKLTSQQKRRLQHHYVRVRYNGQSLVVPGCREMGRNWKGNESFCTLVRIRPNPDNRI
ncbi:uncharacterized protein LDX57_010713 [Aspergillus melleus]|uniref:uncharacterized protein n=1 Tax=Aspergillus melleus TaxID=138277 RepID=UPI001E8E4C5F|nr:uncharacterized protein LDX57_010713 [Aspergillus melleus]KAH8433076.1 hypothetical protein LDX57_010713 [Aspergillus melleus]